MTQRKKDDDEEESRERKRSRTGSFALSIFKFSKGRNLEEDSGGSQ